MKFIHKENYIEYKLGLTTISLIKNKYIDSINIHIPFVLTLDVHIYTLEAFVKHLIYTNFIRIYIRPDIPSLNLSLFNLDIYVYLSFIN